MATFLNIHRKGRLKAFQYDENFQSWNFGLIVKPKEFTPAFITDYFTVTSATITTFTAYKLDKDLLTRANSWTKLQSAIIDTVSLSTSLIETQINSDADKQRYYCTSNNYLTSQLADGIWFLYFTDSENEFESDIFCITSNVLGSQLSMKWDTTYITFDTTTVTFDNET